MTTGFYLVQLLSGGAPRRDPLRCVLLFLTFLPFLTFLQENLQILLLRRRLRDLWVQDLLRIEWHCQLAIARTEYCLRWSSLEAQS